MEPPAYLIAYRRPITWLHTVSNARNAVINTHIQPRMTTKDSTARGNLDDVKVDVMTHKPRRKEHAMAYSGSREAPVARNSDFVYVNSAYVGSLNSVNEVRTDPPTGVYREQYWACSKWPYGQRILAISVGLLLGTVIGLAVTMVMKLSTNDNVIGGIFKYSPD